MKTATIGLWHLGLVTTACLASKGFEVIAYDPSEEIITKLRNNQSPIFEPGLDDLLQQGIQKKTICYTANPKDIADAELVWVTLDTPVDDHDIADVDSVIHEITKLFPFLKSNAMVLISSQLPVGSTRKLQEAFKQNYPQKNVSFACSPENLRLGKAIDIFMKPDRIIVGIQQNQDKTKLEQVLTPFATNIIWMSLESAEMTKHALNAFLATSVVFINELATICETVSADAKEVERGLKSEERIGPKAYLRPGNAIAGGTLARDVNYLIHMGRDNKIRTPLFSAILDSNQMHKQWSCHKMTATLKNLKDKTITLLGLTYKLGTDTLRRSTAVETAQWLAQQGANVIAYDPAIKNLPDELAEFIQLKTTLHAALSAADGAVITTEHPEFSALTADEFIMNLKQPFIFDPSGFLYKNLANDKRIHYFSVGN